MDVVLVSPPPAWTRSPRRWRRRGGLLRGRRRGRLNRRRGRWRWRLRSRVDPGCPCWPTGVVRGWRICPDTGARFRPLRCPHRGRRNARDQCRAAQPTTTGSPAVGGSDRDSMRNPAGGGPEQQQRMERTLRQLEAKGWRRDPEDPFRIARLESCAPEVAGGGRCSHKRRQTKRLSGDEHAASMRLAADGEAMRPAARPGFSPAPSRGRGQRPPIAATRPPTARERAGPRRSWR